jgi:glycosyltransferase involved in cell wall biosynthesis
MANVVIVSGLGKSLVSFRGPLLARLVEKGHAVTAMAPEAEAPAGLAALGVAYVQLPVDRTGADPLRDLGVIARLRALLVAGNVDVVLGYNVKPMVYAMLAAAAAGVRRRYALITGLGYLFLPDGTRRQRLLSLVARPLYRAALQLASSVFVQNPDDERDLKRARLLPSRQHVVRVAGSGIDLRSFPEHPVPTGPQRFLFVGRLLKDKGIYELAEAARRLRATHPEARVAVLGGLDPNPSSVSAEVLERWRQEGVLDYLGETSDVRPFLRECTVFVLPSYREGTPRSVLEAMATGRAVVTTDAPGCRETVVDSVNGFLVPVKDAAALCAALRRFVENPGLAAQMGAASRQLAVDKFDVEKVVSTMVEAMEL